MPKSSKSNVETGTSQISLSDELAGMQRQHDNNNPLWQGPCGEGWNGGITQSMLGYFLSCRERFRLKYVLGLAPHDKWHHTWGYGNMWHVCEEALAKGADWMTYLGGHLGPLCSRYPMQREDLFKWHNVCRVQFPEYIRFWHNHPDVKGRTTLLQEQGFDIPYTLPSGRVVRLRGKWDSVDLIEAHTDEQGRQWPKGIWLQENKTKGDIDQIQVERQLSFDLQTMLYLVALEEFDGGPDAKDDGLHSDNWKHPVLGVRYNVVRRPLSGGKGNISMHKSKQNKVKGTYTPAETEEHFYNRLRDDYIAKEPEYWFFRVKAGISAQDIKVFKDTCLDPLLETVCWWYDDVTNGWDRATSQHDLSAVPYPPMNYRTPFGVYSAREEGGSTEYDHYMATGSESTLRRVTELFSELKED